VSWGEELNNSSININKKKIESSNCKLLFSYSYENLDKKKFVHLKQPSEMKLVESGHHEDSEELSSMAGQDHVVKKAIRDAIDVQSSDESSSKETMKQRHPNYNSTFAIPSNHVKLTKLKREINRQKNDCLKIIEANKDKEKEKKFLEGKIERLKQEINDLKTGSYTQVTESEHASSDFINQRHSKAT
jgi:hypothetical protein